MLCILDQETMCLYGKCRYYLGEKCVLENIDRSGWPSLDERLKKDTQKKSRKVTISGEKIER